MGTQTSEPGERLLTTNYTFAWLSNLSFYFGAFFVMIALPLYVTHLGGSASDIGIVMGTFNITSLVMRLMSGKLVDLHGRKLVMLFGVFVLFISGLLYNLADSVSWLVLIRILQGVGMPCFIIAGNTFVADITPPSRRAEGIAYYNIAGNIAHGMAPPLGVILITAISFNFVFMAIAGTGLAAILLVMVLKEKHEVVSSSNVSMQWKSLPIHPRALFPAFVLFCQTMPLAAIQYFMPVFAIKQGFENPGLFFTVFAVVTAVANTVSGRVADRYGRAVMILPGMAFTALSMLVLGLASSMPVFLFAALLYGLGPAMVQPALLAFTIDRVGFQSRGTAVGTYQASQDIAFASGAFIMGLLSDAAGFATIYYASGVVVLMGLTTFVAGIMRTSKVPAQVDSPSAVE